MARKIKREIHTQIFRAFLCDYLQSTLRCLFCSYDIFLTNFCVFEQPMDRNCLDYGTTNLIGDRREEYGGKCFARLGCYYYFGD